MPQMALGVLCVLIQEVMLVYENYNVIAFKFCIQKFTACLQSCLVLFNPKYDSGPAYLLKKALSCLTQYSGTSSRIKKNT